MSIYSQLDIPDFKKKTDQMLFIDYLLGNTDRHLNNFGVIRDAKTLKFLRVAPIYDTGSCLGYNLKDDELAHLYHIELLKKYETYISPSRRRAINTFLTNRINNILSYIKSNDRIDEKMIVNSLPILEEEILEYVEKKGKLVDLNPLIKKTGKAYITIYRAVSSLTYEGYLIRVGSRKTGYWTLP